MSDFSDWVQNEIAERVSTGTIAATGSFLVKANNVFSKDYVALAQGTSGQILVSQGAAALPTWIDNVAFDINILDVDTIAAADTLAFYDDDGAHNNKITFANFEGTLDHDALTNTHDLTVDIDHDTITNTHNLNTDLDIIGLTAANISGGDSIPYYNAGFLSNRRITFTSFEGLLDHNNLKNTHDLTTDIDHDSIVSGTIASHDTTATGVQLNTLTGGTTADLLHNHSKLVASDGSPDPAMSADAAGNITAVAGLNISGHLSLIEQGADPSNPAEGNINIWQSDGTGFGDDGDLVAETQAGAVTKTATLIDFSLLNTSNV
ncbi:hypothetical protein LCGC14_2839860, partial [marine sediment metagenome]